METTETLDEKIARLQADATKKNQAYNLLKEAYDQKQFDLRQHYEKLIWHELGETFGTTVSDACTEANKATQEFRHAENKICRSHPRPLGN